jgi:hypothetical protein
MNVPLPQEVSLCDLACSGNYTNRAQRATVSTLNYCGGGPRLASRIKCWCCLRTPVACCCSTQEPAQAARTTALRPPFVIVASSGRCEVHCRKVTASLYYGLTKSPHTHLRYSRIASNFAELYVQNSSLDDGTVILLCHHHFRVVATACARSTRVGTRIPAAHVSRCQPDAATSWNFRALCSTVSYWLL